MSNVKLNPKELSDFKEVIDYLLEIKNSSPVKKIPAAPYYREIAELLGNITAGGVGNMLFNDKQKAPSLSRKAFWFFRASFERLTAQRLEDKQQRQLQKYKIIYNDWVNNYLKKSHALKTSQSKKNENPTPKNDNKKNAETKKAQGFPALFQQSKWYCYVRTDRDGAGKEIGRMTIEFGKLNSHHQFAVVISHYKLSLGTWHGTAFYDTIDKILVINAVHADHKKNVNPYKDYSHSMFKVDPTLEKVDLCIGHVVFRSKRYLNIVSKTAIITRYTNAVLSPLPAIFSFNSKKIDPDIRRFFLARELNRLSSPHAVPVYDMETFAKWINQNHPEFPKNYEPYVGEYKMLYRLEPMEKEFIEDYLTISSTLTNRLDVEYKHKVFKRQAPKIWRGQGYPNFQTRVMSFYLNLSPTDGADPNNSLPKNDKPMFLMIDIPAIGKENINTLTGIATSNRDPEKGVVSRLIILLRTKDGKLMDEFNETELNEFFDFFANTSKVRSTISYDRKTAISEFNDLEKVRKEWMERAKNKIKGKAED